MRRYTVILEHGPKNWSAYVPDLPGCVAAATTRKKTESLIREAILLHIEALREDGDPIPEPTTAAFSIAIPA
jgi:predicted RNase H-like HicB family nuclease